MFIMENLIVYENNDNLEVFDNDDNLEIVDDANVVNADLILAEVKDESTSI